MTHSMDRERRLKALESCVARVAKNVGDRVPEIDFWSERWKWPAFGKSNNFMYGTHSFTLSSLDKSCTLDKAERFLIGTFYVVEKKPSTQHLHGAFKKMREAGINSIFDIDSASLIEFENYILSLTENAYQKAGHMQSLLTALESAVEKLVREDVLQGVSWKIQRSTKKILLDRDKENRARTNLKKPDLIHRVNAFNDLLAAAMSKDERLDDRDYTAIFAVALLGCAPSRANEVLTLTTESFFDVPDYEATGRGKESRLYRLILQKGSKGASWTVKPILKFMVGLSRLSAERLTEMGSQSRAILEHYEEYPNKMFLPKGSEHLRKKDWWTYEEAARALVQNDKSDSAHHLSKQTYIERLLSEVDSRSSGDGSEEYSRTGIEKKVLNEVTDACNYIRHVTDDVFFKGKLSTMLLLCDAWALAPYLPGSMNYRKLSRQLSNGSAYKKQSPNFLSTFEKLNIHMLQEGRIVPAFMKTHDFRHYLHDMADKHADRVSDVVMNKFANRHSKSQLQAYLEWNSDERVEHTSLDQPEQLVELQAVASEFEKDALLGPHQSFESSVGTIRIVSLNDLKSLNPDGRADISYRGRRIVPLATPFGLCFHREGASPCQMYRTRCLGCDDQIVTKGDLPAEDKIRAAYEKYHSLVLRSLSELIDRFDLDMTEDPEKLKEWIVSLSVGALDPEALLDNLLDEWEDIKGCISDNGLRAVLDDLYSARGYLSLIDDPKVSSGALIKRNNPSRSGQILLGEVIEALGGRNEINEKAKILDGAGIKLLEGDCDER